MHKLLGFLFPAVAVIVIVGAMFGYVHVTAKGSPQLTNAKVLEDKQYLTDNQDKYADCHYTVEIGDFSIATVTNKYFNQGVSTEKLESLETQFKDKYKRECEPLINEYRSRYSQYEQHKKEAAEAELSQLDKWLGKEAEVISEPSSIFGLYQEHNPKSLQHPTNPNAKMLYSQQDYETFVTQSL